MVAQSRSTNLMILETMLSLLTLAVAATASQLSQQESPLISAKVQINQKSCTLIDLSEAQLHRGLDHNNRFEITKFSDEPKQSVEIAQVTALDEAAFHTATHSLGCLNKLDLVDVNADNFNNLQDEVVKIIDSGPAENRIDVVFMGDGYTLSQRDQFFADMNRLAKDMWSGDTFASVKPLVNVWFVPQLTKGDFSSKC